MIRLITNNRRIIEQVEYSTLNPTKEADLTKEVEVVMSEYVEINGKIFNSDDNGIVKEIQALQGQPKSKRFLTLKTEVAVIGFASEEIADGSQVFYLANSVDSEDWEDYLLSPWHERKLAKSVQPISHYWNSWLVAESAVNEALDNIEFYNENKMKSQRELLVEMINLNKQVEELEIENEGLYEEIMERMEDY